MASSTALTPPPAFNGPWTKTKPDAWYQTNITKSGNKVAAGRMKEGFDLDDTDLDDLRDDLIEYLRSMHQLDEIKKAPSDSGHLKKMRKKWPSEWVRQVNCPRLRDQAVPQAFRDDAAAFFWEKILSAVRGYTKLGRHKELKIEIEANNIDIKDRRS